MVASPVFLLETKLHAPKLRAETLDRPRLCARLDEALKYPVTLVSAPAGFGKSTLVADWLSRLGGRSAAAWYSLDERDDEPLRFARYLLEAVSRAHATLAEIAAVARNVDPELLDDACGQMLNAVAGLDTDLVVVVDDLHLISDERVLGAIALLAEHAPPTLHLLLLTRADPQLPLARLRARRQLLEVRAHDLRFSIDEADALMRQMLGVELPHDRLQTLDRRTEGWAAGLQLVALAARQGGDAGDAPLGAQRYLFDYLAFEVFEQLDEATRDFLLDLSVLERISGPLADAVTGTAHSQRRLLDLYRRNLFLIALDERDEWFRFHHLFADFLRRTREERSVDVGELHRRASAWFEARGLVGEAVDHALRAGDEARAVRVTEQALIPALMRGTRVEFSSVLRWIHRFPPSTIEATPGLAIPLASVTATQGRLAEARRWLECAERTMQVDALEAGSALWILYQRVRAWLRRYAGDVAGAAAVTRSALGTLSDAGGEYRSWLEMLDLMFAYEAGGREGILEELERAIGRSLALGQASPATLLTSGAVHLLLERGELRRAREYADEVWRQLQQLGSGYTTVPALLADLAYEVDDLDEAERYARVAAEGDTFTAYNECFVPPLITLARVLLRRGEEERAIDALERFRRRVGHLETVQAREVFPAFEAELRLELGDLSAARAWAEASGWTPEAPPPRLRTYPYLTAARVRLGDGRVREALRMATKVRERAEAEGLGGVALAAGAVESHAYGRLGDVERASRALRPALELASREGHVRAFLDEGEGVRPVLRAAVADPAVGSYAAHLLGRDQAAGHAASTATTVPLSEREREVLRFLAAGLSNRAIADELVVSVDTVKTHVRNVYGKLDVHTRTQAVARARELRLI